MRTLSIKRKEIPPLTRMAAGGFTLAGVLAVGSLAFVTRPLGLFVLLGGAVLVAIASAVLWLTRRQSAARRASRFAGTLSGAIQSDRGESMSRQDLLDAINEGLDTIKSARKSIYFRPWYLVVGPAGVGKTEAIRNSGVDLPKLRKDPLQGLGGTRTMHWWFANDAVIIDTAGRLFDAPDDSPLVDRWNEFLKLLRNARRECPINGLIVVISAEDLLRDDWKAHAKEKAPHFARQLERIQRSLGRLRFPVYLMVTKCDLVPGFQSFMREIGHRDLQQQIFGWSKPGEPDTPMSADDAARGVEQLIDRIRRRRDLILPHTTGSVEADPWKNTRLDRVDELYVFPQEFARLVEPVRAYMEGMLSQDAWSSGQLFFRGVYFSTSLQDGRVLDKALARATGRDLNDLPRVETEESKPYFLRDLFTEKIFREQGLVSEADSLKKQRRLRAALITGTAAALLIALSTLAFTGYTRFKTIVGRHVQAWAAIASDVTNGGAVEATFVSDAADQRSVRLDTIQRVPASQQLTPIDGSASADADESLRPIAPLLASAYWSQQPIRVPWEFAWIGPIFGNWGTDLLAAQRQDAHRALVEGRVLVPMVHAAYRRAAGYAAADPQTRITPQQREQDERALAAVLTLHTLAAGLQPSAATEGNDPAAFVRRQIVQPLLATVQAAPALADATAEGEPAAASDAASEAEAWANRIEPALRHLAVEALLRDRVPAVLSAGSPIRRALSADAQAAGRRMVTPQGETIAIENTVLERAIDQLPLVHQLPGAYDDPMVPLSRLRAALASYRDAERGVVAEIRGLSIADAVQYAAFAQRWNEAQRRLSASAGSVLDEDGPWQGLPEEMRAALLAGQPRALDAALAGLGTQRQDGYQRTRQLLLDGLPAPGTTTPASPTPDPATIAARAASAVLALPALELGPNQAAGAALLSDWERALLRSADPALDAPAIAQRAAAVASLQRSLLDVPDYELITAAISRPAWFTLALTEPSQSADQPPPHASSSLPAAWLDASANQPSPLAGDDGQLPDLRSIARSAQAQRQAWLSTHEAARLLARVIGSDDPAPSDRAIGLAVRRTIESKRRSRTTLATAPLDPAAVTATLGLPASEIEKALQLDAPSLQGLASKASTAQQALLSHGSLDAATRDTLKRLSTRLASTSDEAAQFWTTLPERLGSHLDDSAFAPLLSARDWDALRAAAASLTSGPTGVASRYQLSVIDLLGLHAAEAEHTAAYRLLSDSAAWRTWLDTMAAGDQAWAHPLDALLSKLAAASTPAGAAALLPDDGPLLADPVSRSMIEHARRVLADTVAPAD